MVEPPLIIPVFLPAMGCREDCLFCNQKATAENLPSPTAVRDFIEASLAKISPPSSPSLRGGERPRNFKKEEIATPYGLAMTYEDTNFFNEETKEKQIAFYGGSFTAIDKDDQVRYLKEVQPLLLSGLIDSIRISTRPDALDEKTLCLLKQYGVKTVEVGVQSMIDEVLSLARRGHSAADTEDGVSRLKARDFEVGLQLMIGLPGDTLGRFLQTLDRVIELKPDFLRIHPTLVLKGAPLEDLWRAGEYSPMQLSEAVQWLKRGVLKLEKASMRVVRIGLQPTKDLERDYLAGPYHPALHQLVDSAIFFDMATSLLQSCQENGRVVFFCHPKEVSNLRGQKNENILKLKKDFKLTEILIEERKELPEGFLELRTQTGEISIHKKSLLH